MENKYKGYGAILGDIVGKPYEMKPIYTKDFDFFNPENHFTDDTIMTIATMDAILHNIPYAIAYKYWGNKYYGDYYGKNFKEWLKKESFEANDSFGNGAAMRISPVGYAFSWPYCTIEAMNSVKSSHDNHQAIIGGIIMANCVRKLYLGYDKKVIEDIAKDEYGAYFPEQLVPFEKFKVSCNYTVPVAIKIFLETENVEEAIRTAVSLGGDCDTIASMAAELHVAHLGVMEPNLVKYVEDNIPEDMLTVLLKFNKLEL